MLEYDSYDDLGNPPLQKAQDAGFAEELRDELVENGSPKSFKKIAQKPTFDGASKYRLCRIASEHPEYGEWFEVVEVETAVGVEITEAGEEAYEESEYAGDPPSWQSDLSEVFKRAGD